MPGLRVFLLGPPRFERDGAALELGRRKNVALVAYVALTGQRHSRETLITLLWPELEPSAARNNLRRNLSVLRNALGTEWLVAGWESVGLDPNAGVWVDVDRFRGLVQAWRTHDHAESEPCPQCLTDLAEAVELYRGDFLAGFGLADSATFDDWQFFEGEGLRRELASALEWLVQAHGARAHNARGSYEEAIGYARRWLALDPLHEPVQRRLMQLYAQAGQRAAALRQYDECERVLEEELGLPPEEETTRAYRAIKQKWDVPPLTVPVSPEPAAHWHNLPLSPIPFVGREAPLAEIADRLQDPTCRLLTLVGPGGCGKTRLALEAAAARLADFEDGVFFVSLAPLRSVEGIVPTVAQALGFSLLGGGDPAQQLLNYLRRRKLLLILDNFEHLLAGVELVTDVLKTAPHVKLLVTTRAGLKLRGEVLFQVTGMDTPERETSRDALDYSAVKLFVQSAQRARRGYEQQADDLQHVVHICRLVDGMPLGILLAAAWVEMLTPREIAAEIGAELGSGLGRGLDFLETDLRDVPERQRSMRAAFDHSWRLLTERQRELLQALSVFRGGFTQRAAQRVAGASLRDLKGLLDRSLLQRAPARATTRRPASGQAQDGVLGTGRRYELHELLRQYAAERLDQTPQDAEEVHERHCATYVAALEQWEADLKGPRQQAALAEMEVEIENARAAWHWAAERAQARRLDRAIEGLCLFYMLRFRVQELEADCGAAAKRLAGAVSGEGPVPSVGVPATDRMGAAERMRVLAKVLVWQAWFLRGEVRRDLGQQTLALLEQAESAGQDTRRERAFALLNTTGGADCEECRRLLGRSLALYHALGDPYWTVEALLEMGIFSWFMGAYAEAREHFERCLSLSQAHGDQVHLAFSTMELGIIARLRGELAESEHLLEQAIARHQEIGSPGYAAAALNELGLTLCFSGKFTQAQSALEESVAILEELGHLFFLAGMYTSLALTAVLVGQWEPAKAAAQRSLALFRETDATLSHPLPQWLLSCLALAERERGLDPGTPPHLRAAGKVQAATAEARRLAQESVATLRQVHHRAYLAWVLPTLGVAERGLGDPEQARQHLCEALRISAETGAFLPPLFALPGTALLLADRGEGERAVELYAMASRYPMVANSPWFELVFGRHIAAVAATLPPEVAATAQERGRAREMGVTVEELVRELGGSRPGAEE